MEKKQVPIKKPKLDMNPMVDLAFLLVSFFMLATTFKTAEPILIDKPFSQSQLKVPETDVITITVSDSGKIYFSIDGKFARIKLLDYIGDHYDQDFSETEKSSFELLSSFGMPVAELQSFLALPAEQRQDAEQAGIPCDSTYNELTHWVLFARMANPKVRIAINADRDVYYQHVQKVIKTLLSNGIYRFNLITELEESR